MNIKDLTANEFRGNVLIVQNDKVLFEYSNGYSDLANRIPNTFDTRFATASMGKTFVATGILQLIERGKLSFGDTLGKLLDFDLKAIDPGVTMEQLLTHTSGVPDYFDESVMDDYEELWVDYPCYKIRHNSDLIPLFIDKPMMYPKGEKFQYNNTGYVLLALIIEKISGKDFDAFLKENIFDVCGMKSTGYFELDRLPSRCAGNYIYCEATGDFRTNIFSVGAKGTGDGGAFITVGDLLAFWKGLLEGRLLGADMVKKMLSKQSGNGEDPEEGYYGYGVWIIDNPNGSDYVYMQGFDPGVSVIAEYNPDKAMISIMVSNYTDDVWAIMRGVRKAYY